MISTTIRMLGSLAGLALLAVCGTPHEAEAQGQAPPASAPLEAAAGQPAALRANDIVPSRLIVAGMPATAALESEKALNKALGALGAPVGSPPANLRAKINQLRNANLKGNKSIGGIFSDAFLDAAADALSGNNFAGNKRVITFMSGQITDYNRENDGSGYIESTTFITRVVVPKGAGAPPIRTTAFRYRVEVAPGGFSIISRDDNASDGPFPGTLAFSPEMKARVALLGFNKKLWAKGTAIDVTSVAVDRNYNPAAPNFVALPSNHPIYQTDAESCIDMMFNIPSGNDEDVPKTFAELQAPPFYCLGRCANPLLINTR